jgi:uncharacterized membrane protein
MKKKTGALIATVVAGLVLTGSLMAATETMPKAMKGKVKCMGVNACKGHGMCKSADNTCKGMNSCKGKGWVMKSQKKCTAKGGTMMKE